MTQAADCGSTPAALTNVNDLASLKGICGVTEAAVTSENTSSSVPGNNANNNGQVDAGTVISTDPSPTSRAQTPGSSSSSGGESVYESRLMITWCFFVGMLALTHWI